MKSGFIQLAAAVSLSSGLAVSAVQAQAPAGPNNGVQVAVPQGTAAQQAADAARQQQQQAARNRLANQPAPRPADGHIVLGNTPTLKGVWIGGGLGFCNSNTVAAPPSLNPGATNQQANPQAAAPGRAGGAGQAAG